MEQNKHAPGTFCWAELQTTDGPGAKKFYSEVFGWVAIDDKIPGAGVYTMLQQDGGNVGALYELNEQMRKQGIPPNWMPYVTVESAADTAKKAKELGATVIMDAFDVMDVGSMAVLKDPSGATVSLWQPKKHTGWSFTDGRPGTVSWNELTTRDVDAAGTFFTSLFGWGTTTKQIGPVDYTIFTQGEAEVAGMMPMEGPEWEGIPPHWMIYWAVADCAATVEQVKKLGGAVKVPPTPIPEIGTFSVMSDPQGAVFSVIQMQKPAG